MTKNFSRRITVSDANNIVAVLDLNILNFKYQAFEQDYIVEFQVAIEDVKCTVGLFSLSPAPFPNTNDLQSDAKNQAEIAKTQTENQKIALGIYFAEGNGPWEYKSRVVLQNQQGDENHVPILVPFMSTNETMLVGGNFKLGVRIEPVWNQPLKAQDYIVVMGTFKQVVSFSKKKDDSLESLSDRISALENLLAVYGAPSASLPGSNGLVPAPPAGGGEFLLKGDRNWQNPSAFISSSNSGIYGSAEIPATPKGGWSGIFFAGGGNKNYLMVNPTSGDIGFYDSSVPKWNLLFSSTNSLINGPLSISGLPGIRKIQFLSTIISLPNIVSAGLHQVDIAFSGAGVGQYVQAVPTINAATNGVWTFYIHAQILVANTVSLFFKNDWSVALDLPDFWIRIMYVETA